jgi:hypothetical protein
VTSNRDQERVFLDSFAGSDRAGYEAQLLKESGARISRNSQARYFGYPSDPVVRAWVQAQKRSREDPYG